MDQVCDATLKRTFLSLLSHNALVDLVLALDAGTATTIFPADLQAEVKRLQAANESTNGADPDADGEGSPDPQPAPALQKAYKRGRLEKVGAKYKLNPNWHGGATTNRTTRRPQSMAELPGNYAWAPPPVAPIQSVPPDPRLRDQTPTRHSQPPQPQPQATQLANPVHNAPSGSGPDFDAQAQVASLLRALQDHNHTGEQPVQGSSTQGQIEQPGAQEGRGQALQLAHLSMPSATTGLPSGAGPNLGVLPPPPVPPAGTAPPQAPAPAPGPSTAPGVPGMPPAPVPVPVPGSGVPYPGYHAPTPLQASLATLASQLANMSKANQGT
ncbi:hypothetical protein FS749_005330 [Ceratobasidium sp. UAMH 11750]|nr:hypothetical protein FS749_005330 [Ceratobasidium sp. UAMH 11750]